MDLSGRWRAQPSDEELRRAYPGRGFDDSSWTEVEIPSHWRSCPQLASYDGPVLYRHHFDAPSPEQGRRWWLSFEGIFYQGDVWLDGCYLGDTEGYFQPHVFEVTDLLRVGSEHVLAVEVTCTPVSDRKEKHNITGVFQHWDCLDPDWNPGGIWRPVVIEDTGAVRIARLRALCVEATSERALLSLRAVLDAAVGAIAIRMRTTVKRAGAPGEVVADRVDDHVMSAGENRIAWSVPVPGPELWWPHALGAQPLYDVAVEVKAPGGTISHRRQLRTGLRQLRMKRWVLSVNGERLFLKGTNQGPTRMALGEAHAADLEGDVALARDAGLDLLRVHGHISRPELYEAADRHGLLLWQDFPLQWAYARGIRKQAVEQARRAVDLLGHHPSVALWCAHNEPFALDIEPGSVLSARQRARLFVQQQLPGWNKTFLDGSLRRAFERADPSRPVVANSGVLPHPGSTGTDSHLYLGWYVGEEDDLSRHLARWPRRAGFVSEFGAQAVPTTADFMHPEQWPDLDWARLGRTHGLQKAIFDRRVPPESFTTFEEWQRATQDHQAGLIRHYVETLRRLKYRPTGGFCQFSLADGHPGVSWAVLDHERIPKPGYEALAAACAPVIVVADRPHHTYRAGDSLALDVHVVSDLHAPITDARVDAVLSWEGGGHHWTWAGDVPADSCVRVGTVQAVVPEAEGPLTLDLDLQAAQVKASNQYASRISVP